MNTHPGVSFAWLMEWIHKVFETSKFCGSLLDIVNEPLTKLMMECCRLNCCVPAGFECWELVAPLCLSKDNILQPTPAGTYVNLRALSQTCTGSLLLLNTETLERVPTPSFAKLVRCFSHKHSCVRLPYLLVCVQDHILVFSFLFSAHSHIITPLVSLLFATLLICVIGAGAGMQESPRYAGR